MEFLAGLLLGLAIAAIAWHPKLKPLEDESPQRPDAQACQNLLREIRSREAIRKEHEEAEEAVAELRQELGV